MKKQLTILSVLASSLLFSQKIIFSEDFNDYDKVGDWGVLDRDRDSHHFEFGQGSDEAKALGWDDENGNMIIMFGFSTFPGQFGPLDPDNVLISPLVQIPNENKRYTLNFKMGTITSQLSNFNLQVFVLKDGERFFPTLTPILTKNFNGIEGATSIDVDLSKFKGDKVRIFWRVYDSFSQYLLLLDDVNITESDNLLVEDTQKQKDIISIYPNPATDILNINGIESKGRYKIYDVQGNEVMSGSNKTQVNISHLNAGVYVIVVTSDDKKQSFKFIKK